MGATSSSNKVDHRISKGDEESIKLVMPMYYSEEAIELEEVCAAKFTWHLVLNDEAPEFLSRKRKAGFQYRSCVSFFYDSFYTRLFDVHPVCRPLFVRGTTSQGKFLVKMIGLALSELEHDDPLIFEKTLHHLANVHFERGVKAVECKFNVNVDDCYYIAMYLICFI